MHPDFYGYKTHCSVCGESQSGKSKFCEWCMREHVIRGNGFCLLDWHGTLFTGVRDYLAYVKPRTPVYELNLSQPDWITPFNCFHIPIGADISAHAARMAKVLVKSWGESVTDMPTFQRVAKALITFCAVTGEPLHHGAQLLDRGETALRRWAIGQLRDHRDARTLLEEIDEAKRPGDWRALVQAAQNRFASFAGSRVLTRFMGLPDKGVSTADYIGQKAIVLVNLAPSPDLDEEAAKSCAAVVLSEFLYAGLQNAAAPKPYYIYCDEAANYLTADAAAMLDQSLKSGLRLTIISHHENQPAFQKHPEIRDSLRQNAGIKCIFHGIPLELAKQYAEEFFADEVNAEQVRRVNMRTITVHEEDWSESYTDVSAEGEFSGVSSSHATHFGPQFAPRSKQEIGSYDVWTREEKIGKLAQRFMKLRRGQCIISLHGDVFLLNVHRIVDYGRLLNPAALVKFLSTLRSNSISKFHADEIIKSEAARFAERSNNASDRKPKKRPANLYPQGR